MANKRKTTTAVVAAVAASALLLGGTFAWYSISQEALNEKAGVVNVGGRLHDDFNGTNKDIYVENFTDPLEGGQPIYARIRLDEYMEVGPEAGLTDEYGNFIETRNAQSVVTGAKIDDDSTWSIHQPQTDCTKCTNGDLCQIHAHWTWEMGGQTIFMPTFNKDKDSLQADINGTYDGKNANDTIHYDDYVEYVDDAANAVDGKVYQKTADAYYDDDENDAENDHVNKIGVTVESETHYGKKTVAGTVITMEEWKNTYDSAPGDYWVYDTDGWAYWANPIMPGEATGLLLSNIKMTENPGEKCYYAINVVGQFATVGDWEYFSDDAPTTDALDLLTKASQNVPVVTVNQADNITFVTPGYAGVYDFNASVAINGASTIADTDFEWSVYDENLDLIDPAAGTGTTINTEGELTVAAGETNKTLTIVARSTAHGGAVGAYAVGVRQNIETTDVIENSSAYVLLTENGTLTSGKTAYKMWFVRSETEPNTAANLYEGEDIYAVYGDFEDVTYELIAGGSTIPWNSIRGQINEAEIVNDLAPTSMAFWFFGMSNVTEIKGLEKVDVTNVTSLRSTFNNTRVTSLDLSTWETTDKLTSLQGMFLNATALTEIKGIENFEVSNVTSMNSTFGNSAVTSLDLSGWNTGNVEIMPDMFKDCTSLENLNVSGWDTSNVTSMHEMFMNCKSLTTLDLSSWAADGKNTGSVTTMSYMFKNCTGLTNLNVSGWDTSKVTTMVQMFYGCSSLGDEDIAGIGDWDVSNVTNMFDLFHGCSSLQTVNLSNWAGKTGNVESIDSMFQSCSSLQTVDLSGWDTSKVTTTQEMFWHCKQLTTVNGIGGWDVSSLKNVQTMFGDCTSLATLDLSGWASKTGNMENMQGMFTGCTTLASITGIENWNVSGVKDMKNTFLNCSALTANLSGWTVTSVTDNTAFADGASGVVLPTAWQTTTTTTTTTAATTDPSTAS